MIKESTSEKSSPEARGQRVRRLRNMANLSRQEMCDEEDYKLDTLIGWELARHGGLTAKGAQKIINRVAKEGVLCSMEWLLYELGTGPNVISNFASIQESIGKTTSVNDEEQHIIEELLVFKKHHPDSIELLIPDNCMAPIYSQGDYVAGIKYYQDKFQAISGIDCIVQPCDGELLLRRVIKGDLQNCYTLLPLDFNGQQPSGILVNITLAFAAPVIWHRRKFFI